MKQPFDSSRRSWLKKFRDAFSGAAAGVRGQSSFAVHFLVAVLVVVAAAVLQVSLTEWCLLLMCITIVLAAEMFNSALETVSKAIDTNHNAHLQVGLNISSAAVLIAAMGSASVGLIVFANRLGILFGIF